MLQLTSWLICQPVKVSVMWSACWSVVWSRDWRAPAEPVLQRLRAILTCDVIDHVAAGARSEQCIIDRCSFTRQRTCHLHQPTKTPSAAVSASQCDVTRHSDLASVVPQTCILFNYLRAICAHMKPAVQLFCCRCRYLTFFNLPRPATATAAAAATA